VTQGGVFHPAAGPDIPDHHQTRGDPDADAEPGHVPAALDLARVFLDLIAYADRRADGALRVVLVGGGRAEEREHAVAGQVLDRPAERLDGRDDPRDRLTDDQLQLLGVEPLGERGGTD